MTAVTLTYDGTLSRVHVAVTGLPGAASTVLVERSTNQVTWSTVRGGAAVPVVDGEASVYDYEFAPGVANYYRVSGPSTYVGAYLDGTAHGTSGWTANAARWTSLTGIPLSAGRWYAGTTYTIGTTLTEMIAAGVRIALDFAPPYDPVSSTDRDAIGDMLADLQAAGADVVVSLWHEPYLGGLTNTEFVDMIEYYGPTVRQYYPLWVVYSGNDAVEANGYFPGADQIDGIAADCYATNTANLDNCETMADAHSLPLGLWEFGAFHTFGITPSPVSSVTQAQATTFLEYVEDLFSTRLATGKPNGDLLFFSWRASNTGTYNWLGDGLSQLGGYEGGISTWVAGGTASAAHSTAQAHSGTGSLALTCTTAGTIGVNHCATANITTQGMPVTPGDVVGFSCWFRPGSTTRTVQAGVTWYNAAGSFLSNSFATGVTENAGAWRMNSGTATAPANAAFVKMTPQISGAALAEVHYLDDPQMGVLPASIDQTAPIQYTWDYRIPLVASIQAALDSTGTVVLDSDSITPTIDSVWLKSIQRPFLNREVTPFGNPPEVERAGRAGVFAVVGRTYPVAVTDVALAGQWTLDLLTDTLEDRRTLELVLSAGDTMLIQVPTSGRLAAVPDGYAVVMGWRQRILPTLTLAEAVTSVSLAEVAAPDAGVVGATVTCTTVLLTYATCADVLLAHPTCADLLTLIGSPDEVEVP